MQFKYKCLLTIAPLIFILDQFTKYLVAKNIAFGRSVEVVPGFFDIVHYTNSGAAFGFLAKADAGWKTPFFYIISVAALVGVAVYIVKMPATERLMAVILSLIVGGIFGNGIDRVRFGEVTDFLSVHIGDKVLWGVRLEWPAFNVADSAITVAMVLLVVSAFRKDK